MSCLVKLVNYSTEIFVSFSCKSLVVLTAYQDTDSRITQKNNYLCLCVSVKRGFLTGGTTLKGKIHQNLVQLSSVTAGLKYNLSDTYYASSGLLC